MKLDRINRLNDRIRSNSFSGNNIPKRPVNPQAPLIDKFYPRPSQVKIYVDDKNFAFSATYSYSNL
jgi:hypothetical protein